MTIATCQRFDLSIEQFDLVQKAIRYESASLSPNTMRSYKSMWKRFELWCTGSKLVPLPASAETVALYISSMAEMVSFSTIDSTLAAIAAVHEKENQMILGDHTLYRRVRRGIRRTHKENQCTKQAPALSVLDLKVACCKHGSGLTAFRDRALLCVTFFGALRRSEAVALDVHHLEFNERGVAVHIMQSKTSDTKETIYLTYAKDQDICPVKRLKEWLDVAGIHDGAVFRSIKKGGKIAKRLSGHGVSEIIKCHFGEKYSGHSARRGLLTSSAEKGTPLHILQKHGRHKSADMSLRYIEKTKSFEDSSVNILGV